MVACVCLQTQDAIPDSGRDAKPRLTCQTRTEMPGPGLRDVRAGPGEAKKRPGTAEAKQRRIAIWKLY